MMEQASWTGIRKRLEARLKAVKSEIAAYPGPITGCDAQFNHLLEERSDLARELNRLDEASAIDGPDAANRFAQSCRHLSGSGEQQE